MMSYTLYRFLILFLCFQNLLFGQDTVDLRNTKINGYRGIWFELNQKYAYGDKYSGGLGTYTAKHIPLAVYSPKADKTFFVYGGTTDKDKRRLLCMIGSFDHKTLTVNRPTVVYDKIVVDDPHDNPVLYIGDDDHIWVFVSGRGTKRKGIKLRSVEPLSTEKFLIVAEEEFTYPQVWHTDNGFFHFFTKYTGVRELYFETSPDGKAWSPTQKLAGIPSGKDYRSGHYQVSNSFKGGAKLATFFNRHNNGHPDTRTDLYYLQSKDHGKTWTTVQQDTLLLPISAISSPARVIDYDSQKKNVYLKDMQFDASGQPILLYITSNGHEPGPKNKPYEWRITKWTGQEWRTTVVCTSDHNYDMGSLYVEKDIWKIVGPTEPGPQKYGTGGEIAIWISWDGGEHWKKEKQITSSSQWNHSYVRRPLYAKAPFQFFWANGNPKEFGKSELFFGDFYGNVYKLPYVMKKDYEKPQQYARE
ncbi:BNR-4 repeat-containing protein [Ulvibacterium sp.]|uniref:BNR-4 repeat-containing protein n=1 Tax=Ulvibacterium sp. TaxID=2665914 RepID=UPI0026091E2A|nr:BNR-4 repeat-containing protein [Ulvibacterium sp.]